MLDFDNNIQKGEGDVSYCIIWDGQPRDLRLRLDRTVHQCDSALAENSEYHLTRYSTYADLTVVV
jgi:hypothetical protein